ncbi:19758_t:CDS:2 [Racocetra fulgida]|uniref:19758_t:CDS:1 n=1 Tax=Racocetra fulgida TaxID=60492 RepID=A0A9N8ZU50_9GLOM|nr:19758_t:CDS:2 [Racocetra fulgida]
MISELEELKDSDEENAISYEQRDKKRKNVDKQGPNKRVAEEMVTVTTEVVDIYELIKQVIHQFNRFLRKSCYDSELYHVLVDFLGIKGYEVIGQYHILNKNGNHKYADIVIKSSNSTIVLELSATARKKDLNEHFTRALNYSKLLSASEVWLIHFTCEDNYTKNPHWPADWKLKKGLRVVHFCHDWDF